MLRKRYLQKITEQFNVHQVCAILGPRQVGKTTLAKMYLEEQQERAIFFDLENPSDLLRLENPMLAFSEIKADLIIIDEVQYKPDLFPILRVIVDQQKERKFLILGSASRDLINKSSETLAGRIGYIELPPFSLFEVYDSQKLWLRGGFPKAYLAETERDSVIWRQQYITTFLERDIPSLGFSIPAMHLRRFWIMLAHYHGQTVSYTEIGKSLMLSDNTIRNYIDILVGTFMIRLLPAWFENIAKRQVKSSKLYFKDSGILNILAGITSQESLMTNPKLGAFWEGYALEEIIRFLNVQPEECYFWATQAEAELDLLILKDGKRLGFEFKYADAPRTTKSMHSAIKDLALDKLYIIYPGKEQFSLTEKIILCGLTKFIES